MEMTFYIPPVFLFGNKVRHNQEEHKAEYKTATETEIQIENRNIKRIAELEEENKKLKDEVKDLVERNIELDKKYMLVLTENRKLNIKVASLEGEIKGLNSVIDKLKEENQTLELWLDRKEKLNEKYRKEIDKYKKQYQHSMGFMEEDTLQELRDIGEI